MCIAGFNAAGNFPDSPIDQMSRPKGAYIPRLRLNGVVAGGELSDPRCGAGVLKLIDGTDLDAQRYAVVLDKPRKKYGKYARNIVIFHRLIGLRLPWGSWHRPAGSEK